VNIPELLAPAGTLEKLRFALHYGADAVYLGGGSFGLRSNAGNFTLDEMSTGLDLCHAVGAKAYLTINSYPHDNQLAALEQYLNDISQLPFDAYIISDPGVIRMVRRISPDRDIHLSTQANTINRESVLFWQDQGVKRVNLAREMTLEDIKATISSVKVPCEVFTHGALCIAYSGRCLISSALTGRSANHGECTHPCRWSYNLVEERRPGEYFPVEEYDDGTFIFNSKDLCLLEYLPELIQAGVASLKIEGRMKGIHYLASVLRVYRAALDSYRQDQARYSASPEWFEELSKPSHRGYTTGFMLGAPQDVGQAYDNDYIRTHTIVGVVEEILPDGKGVVGVRNQFFAGTEVELLGPAMRTVKITPDSFSVLDGNSSSTLVTVANTNQRIIMDLPESARPLDLLRVTKD
jgi:U32 family peptidase